MRLLRAERHQEPRREIENLYWQRSRPRCSEGFALCCIEASRGLHQGNEPAFAGPRSYIRLNISIDRYMERDMKAERPENPLALAMMAMLAEQPMHPYE